MHVTIDFSQVAALRSDLETKVPNSFRYAAREYVNSAAFEGRKEYIGRANASMTLRTKWTERSIQVDKARSLRDPMSRLGSVADYMATQEDGATIGKKGKYGTPIPAAAPGKRKGRKGKVATANRLSRIALQATVTGSRQRRNAVAIAMAGKRGGGYVFLDLRRTKGIFRVTGTKRGTRIRKVWDLTKKSVRVLSNPMLGTTVRAVQRRAPELATKAILFQLRRAKVLGY